MFGVRNTFSTLEIYFLTRVLFSLFFSLTLMNVYHVFLTLGEAQILDDTLNRLSLTPQSDK